MDQLEKLLEFEIDRVRAAESRHGWSKWALWSGLGVVLWFISIELGSINLNGLVGIALSLITVLMTWEFLKRLANFMPKSRLNKKECRFLPIYDFIAPSRVRLIFESFRAILLALIAVWLGSAIGTYSILIAIFFGIDAIIFILGLFVSYWENLVINWGRSKPILNGGLLLLAAISLYGLGSAFWNQLLAPLTGAFGILSLESASRLAAAVRIGGLSAASIIILQTLSSVDLSSPFLENLEDIRRNIGLGKLDIEAAREQTEIALIGLAVPHIFQEEISLILATLQQAIFHIEQRSEKFKKGNIIIERKQGKVPSTAEFQELQELLNSIKAHKQAEQAVSEQFKKDSEDFEKKSKAFLRLYPECEGEINSLKSKVWAVYSKLLKAQAELEIQTNKAKKLFTN